MSNEDKTQELISFFSCEKDKDIEIFLKEKALLFEKLGKSRTYIILDEDDDDFNILAYFTLAIQVLKVNNELLSGRKTKSLDGFSSKVRGSKITEFPAILIGQIGKNDPYKELISGLEVMELCLSMVLKGQQVLGGRIVMLECKDIEPIINLYQKFDFRKLDKDHEKDELLQMIRVLESDDIIESKGFNS